MSGWCQWMLKGGRQGVHEDVLDEAGQCFVVDATEVLADGLLGPETGEEEVGHGKGDSEFLRVTGEAAVEVAVGVPDMLRVSALSGSSFGPHTAGA